MFRYPELHKKGGAGSTEVKEEMNFVVRFGLQHSLLKVCCDSLINVSYL